MSDVGTPQPLPAPPSPAQRKRWPSGSQAAILLAAGLVLGIGGCFAFLATMNHNVISMIFGGVFFLGLIAFLAGCLEVIIIVVRGIFNALSGK